LRAAWQPLLLILLALAVPAFAAEPPCAPAIAELVSAQGSIEIRRLGEAKWQPAGLGDTLCAGDRVRVKERSRAALAMANEIVMRLDEQTTVTLLGVEAAQPSLLELCRGALHFFTRYRKTFRVITPFVNAAVEGTELSIDHTDVQDNISVYEGEVRATNEPTRLLPETCEDLPRPAPIGGSLILTSGESGVLPVNQAPSKLALIARPEDAVQWALYYPPIVDYGFGEELGAPGTALRESIELYRQGRIPEAISRIENVPEGSRDSRFLIYRAGLLLLVGRVDEARRDIEQALKLDPGNSNAYALKAIISVVQNQKGPALNLAAKAVELDPKSSAARIALSYAQQANFQIEQALESVKEAVALDPKNALAWARLAELEMSTGYLDRALAAAERAVSLNPNLAKTQTVLGFAHLTRIDTQAAKTSFTRAIELDQADPLPRLGLGLAKIRESNLEQGRREIEIAASLDPAASLTRSYLGKAYYEEKRDELAGTQYDIAKELDPRDPTPWFYDAIRKQTINRPVEALEDLQESIELNDNRAVYRSRLLLDQDLAARSASLARIYSDLGFEQLALVEGYKSVNTDPGNYSAHRFLADAYAALPRHEIARVSELLQSQLRQPLNINALQPQLFADKLFILSGAGPARLGFNEFNPLFARNRNTFQIDGLIGGNDSIGDQLVFAGIRDNLSYSSGQFHFKTNGFGEHSALENNIYDAFIQANVSYRTSVQAEVRVSESDRERVLNAFDPDNVTFVRDQLRTKSFRLGGHHSFSADSDIVFSTILQKSDFEIELEFAGFGGVFTPRTKDFTAEIQHLLRREGFHLVSGASYFEARDQLTSNADKFHRNIYGYVHLNSPKVQVQVGLTAESLDEPSGLRRDEINPKLGVIWRLLPTTTVRAAAFRSVKRPLIANQTIEPTQVAGFNQLFDDFDGTISRRIGVALDQNFSERAYGGVELSGRDLTVPLSSEDFEWEERTHRAYWYWAPRVWLGLSAEFHYEQFKRLPGNTGEDGILELKTQQIPLGLGLFHRSGFSGQVTATYVRQNGTLLVFAGANEFSQDSKFWVTDAAINYRLPKRQGLLTLGIRNLFDNEFQFFDTDPTTPRIAPGRLVFGRLTLAF
jgi:tetratricopeptide (TPR) repeat protein